MPFQRNYRPLPEGKVKKYTHSVTTVDFDGVRVSIAEDGKVTLSRDLANGEYDEVTVSANVIFKTASLLNTTKKVKIVDKSELLK